MLQDLLIPEEFLQLERLKNSIELTDDTTFLAIVGVDTKELSVEFDIYFKNEIKDLIFFNPKTDQIFKEIIEYKNHDEYLYINLFDKKDDKFIKELLFCRDFISDYNLKIILVLKEIDYKNILKKAIDFYNINSFAYSFKTYKVEIVEDVDMSDVDNLIKEYHTKKRTLHKELQIAYLIEIGVLYNNYGNLRLSIKYLNNALGLAKKVKHTELIMNVKFCLSRPYRYSNNFLVSKKYLIECKEYFENRDINSYKTVLKQLSIMYIDYNCKESLIYCDKLYSLSVKLNDKTTLLSSLVIYLRIYDKLEEDNKIEQYQYQALSLTEELNDDESKAFIYESKAKQLIKNNKFSLALSYLDKSIYIHKSYKNIKYINKIYINFAYMYYKMMDNEKASIYIDWCYNYFKNNNALFDLLDILEIKYLIGFSQLSYEKLLDILYESLSIAKKIKSYNLSTFLVYIADVFILKKEYSTASKFLNKSSNIQINYNLYTTYIYFHLSQNNIEKAYEYYYKVLDLIDDNSSLDELYGEILVKDNKLTDALKYFHYFLKNSIKKDNLQRILSVQENLAYLYKKLGNKSMSKRFFTEVLNKLEIINKDDKRIKIIKKELEI